MTAKIEKSETIHKGWTVLSRVTLQDDGKRFHREVEDHGQAVGVLPYDPVRRTALLVQLPRAPVLLSGAGEHLLEAPAGLVDEGEGLEACVKREAYEECGVELEILEPIARTWSSPGISTERIALYLAPYSAAGRTGEGGGLAEEHESITVVERSLADLAAMADAGHLIDLKTLCLLQTLRLKHPELF
jgi:nudix-type nucleoside diphosphatase (YffH/AdpP family)